MSQLEKQMGFAFASAKDSWETSDAIYRRFASLYKNRISRSGSPLKYFFVILLRLEDRGLIEMKKRVVYGEEGGKLVYFFRRAVGAALEIA